MAIIKWQCIKCGKIVTSGVVSGGRAIVPGGRTAGNCPETATGNHIWKKMGQKSINYSKYGEILNTCLLNIMR